MYRHLYNWNSVACDVKQSISLTHRHNMLIEKVHKSKHSCTFSVGLLKRYLNVRKAQFCPDINLCIVFSRNSLCKNLLRISSIKSRFCFSIRIDIIFYSRNTLHDIPLMGTRGFKTRMAPPYPHARRLLKWGWFLVNYMLVSVWPLLSTYLHYTIKNLLFKKITWHWQMKMICPVRLAHPITGYRDYRCHREHRK